MCNHNENSIVCNQCDLEIVQKNERLRSLNHQIDEGNFYDDPSSVMEALWEEREQLKSELNIS